MTQIIRRRLLSLYDHLPLRDRLFVRIRLLLSNLYELERHVPSTGTILDLGCGHGLLTNLLAIASPQRQVIGIDIDPDKITAAQRTIGHRHNIKFELGDAAFLPSSSYDAVAIADVMYLIPPATQQQILKSIATSLQPNGILIWKTHSHKPRWKYIITYAQEWLMTKLGPTQGQGLFFMDYDESLAAIRAAGLHPVVVPMPSPRPYSDILYLGYKSKHQKNEISS